MMYLFLQQQKMQFICLFFLLLTQAIGVPINKSIQSIRCNILHQNCTFSPKQSVSDSFSLSSHFQNSTSRTVLYRARPDITKLSTLATSSLYSTSKPKPASNFDAFSDNLKRAALVLAGIALGLGLLRICLIFCKSRPQNNARSNRRSAIVRPQIATVEHHQFKPDLPPSYAQAIKNGDNDSGKLPSYEELPYDQLQGHDNDGFVATAM